jgi:predicted AAA+ superfamily ATPase
VRGGLRVGFEIKRTTAPRVTSSMRSSRESLKLDALYVIHAGTHEFPMADGIRAVPIASMRESIEPIGAGARGA